MASDERDAFVREQLDSEPELMNAIRALPLHRSPEESASGGTARDTGA